MFRVLLVSRETHSRRLLKVSPGNFEHIFSTENTQSFRKPLLRTALGKHCSDAGENRVRMGLPSGIHGSVRETPVN